MEQPIKHSEIIQPGNPFVDVEKGIKELLTYLEKLQTVLKSGINKELQNLQKANISTKSGREDITKSGQVYEEYGRKLDAVNKLKAKATQVSDDLLKSEIRLKEQAKQRLKNLQDQVRSEGLAANSVDRMRIKMNQLTREYDRADAAMRAKLEPRIKNYQRLITQAEQATGRFQRQVGNYKVALGNAGQALKSFAMGVVGFTAILSTGMRMLRSAVTDVLQFDQAMADVGAISKASTEEMSMLREMAKALGGSTKFTATEVAGLEKVLAKLGFTTTEILNSTNAILSLAAATGEDLAKSADVAGSVLRAFNLDAKEMTRVVDVMTASFSGSALDLEKYSVSMRMVAPVANAFNFSIEQTTALLGTLVNAGFDASMAGTALRNIMLNLANSNGKLAKKLGGTVNTFDEFIPAMIKLRDSGVNLNETLELTDKRSVAAFNRFLTGAEFTRKFREELDKARGSADEMSRKQLDTLTGDLIILKSAWQGLTIAVKDNTKTDDTARGGVELLTKGLQYLTPKAKDAETSIDKWTRALRQAAQWINPITATIKYTQQIFLLFKKSQDDVTESTNNLNVGLGEMEERLKIVAQEKALAEILAEEAAKAEEERKKKQHENFVIWYDDQKKKFEFQKEINEWEKQADKDAFDMGTELAEQSDDDLSKSMDAESQWINQKIQNINLEGQKAQQTVDDKKQAEEKFNQFQQASMQKGLAGLDEFAKERGVILNASLLADQIRSLSATIMALTVGEANTAKVGFPWNIPLMIGFAGQVAGLLNTLRSIKIGGTKYEKGGSGFIQNVIEKSIVNRVREYAGGGSGQLGNEGAILKGERHHSGGVNLGVIGEGEKDEYFGIVNRTMTQRYREDLPQVFETLNKGTFHNVFTRANEMHDIINRTTLNQDPYTRKMYMLMKKQPAVYSDSEGNQVLLWPTGKKRVIKTA